VYDGKSEGASFGTTAQNMYDIVLYVNDFNVEIIFKLKSISTLKSLAYNTISYMKGMFIRDLVTQS